jgi:hypothetical protein
MGNTAPAGIIGVRSADADHEVVTVVNPSAAYRRRPCRGCPWRVEQTGTFPAEAFRLSASTAYDLSRRPFGYHESGTHNPAICAGFLLRGATHNLAIRILIAGGAIDPYQVTDGGAHLHASYRAMAEANGVDPTDPALCECREPHR